jgi:hypothetical protein
MFPNYVSGMDFDIVVSDVNAALKYAHQNFMTKDVEIYSMRVVRREHVHFDILKKNTLEVRFDFINSFDFLKRLRISNTFFIKLFSNCEHIKLNGSIINIPSKLDDLFIRYIEFIEYFEMFPAKEKHLEYIRKCATNEEWMELISMTHNYIRFNREIYG